LSAHYLNDVNDWCGETFGVTLFPANIYALGAIPYRIEPTWVLQVLASAFVLAVLVAYFPARRAARMDPVKALSYE
jgi:lipoprotein-releasing system permease protein